MSNIREKIKEIIKNETESGRFSVLNDGKSILLIEQIIRNYKREGKIERTRAKNQDQDQKPKAELLFIAAPTGAGKDHLVSKLNYQNHEKKYIELNMDIFRHYFPLYVKNIKALTDKDYASMTNEFSYEIYYTVQELLLQEFPGTNIIITGTLRDIDWVEDVFKKFKSNDKTDYTTRLIGLSVPQKESAISVIYRYLSIVNTQRTRLDLFPGTARYTSMEYHDETFKKYPENFAYFERLFREEPGKLLDGIDVYTRSKTIYDFEEDTKVYSSDDENDQRTAVEVIDELRNRDYDIKFEDFLLIVNRIMENKEYLKSQGTLREIVRTLAVVLDYPKVVERLDGMSLEDDDESPGKN